VDRLTEYCANLLWLEKFRKRQYSVREATSLVNFITAFGTWLPPSKPLDEVLRALRGKVSKVPSNKRLQPTKPRRRAKTKRQRAPRLRG
jgi:hypothetical protein